MTDNSYSDQKKWCMEFLNYEFKDESLLTLAFTHRSVSSKNNERLEFLGDAILGFIIADLLFHLKINVSEGDLTRLRARLVQETTLYDIAVNIRLGSLIALGSGEKKSGVRNRPSVLSDTLEAILAAIYLDGGYESIRNVVRKLFESSLDNLPDLNQLKDSKTKLQELLQRNGDNLPNYILKKTLGEDHNQVFYVKCEIEEHNISITGIGSSRKAAEQEAANIILKKLNERTK